MAVDRKEEKLPEHNPDSEGLKHIRIKPENNQVTILPEHNPDSEGLKRDRNTDGSSADRLPEHNPDSEGLKLSLLYCNSKTLVTSRT